MNGVRAPNACKRSARSMTFAAQVLPFACERAPAPSLVPAVARALTLLDRLARGREPMTLARLSSELELPKSSVHGLCTTLVSFGYLRRQADGSFLIGPRLPQSALNSWATSVPETNASARPMTRGPIRKAPSGWRRR